MLWTFYFFFLNSARLELELETARAELDLVSRTDPLTKLYNRRHFDEHARLEFQRAMRYGNPLAFIVLDLDNLKIINDNYGHAVGDSVLSTLSENLRSQIRPFDLLVRLGGDEFIVMLVDTKQEQAYSTANRICEWVSQTPVLYDSYSIQISVSIGVTMVRPEDNDLDRILERTDSALYRAKKQGRNCVVIA
jgi:diguanylate cyclase (GGDEF)-like protein